MPLFNWRDRLARKLVGWAYRVGGAAAHERNYEYFREVPKPHTMERIEVSRERLRRAITRKKQ